MCGNHQHFKVLRPILLHLCIDILGLKSRNSAWFIDSDICLFTVLLTIPAALELSLCIDVGGWGLPNYTNVRCIIYPILSVLNNLPKSDSADNSATFLSMIHTVCIVTLILIGSVLLGILPKKYHTLMIYINFSLVIYETYECMFKIILDF